MPAVNSIEWNAEELVRLKLMQNALLATWPINHWEKKAAATLDAIVVQALKGEVNLDGVGGSNVVVDCMFQTSQLSDADADKLALAVSGEMYKNDPGFVPDLPDIYFVSLEPDTKTDRNNTSKLRRWTVSFPLIIKLVT
jgi:hypothetical protein